MIKLNSFFMLSIILLNTSCSFISYSQAIPLIDKALFGVDDIELSEEFIDSKKYSFVKVKLGKSSVSILTLRSISEGVFEWISASGERIYTYNGKIVKTEGLPYDTYLYSFRDIDFMQISSEASFNYDINLTNPKAFVSQVALLSVIKNTDHNFELKESVETIGFRWKFTNFYTFDKRTQLATKTIQKVHPNLDTLELSFIYK
jgi:hypothetical protein